LQHVANERILLFWYTLGNKSKVVFWVLTTAGSVVEITEKLNIRDLSSKQSRETKN
jgi:hypothetical protein